MALQFILKDAHLLNGLSVAACQSCLEKQKCTMIDEDTANHIATAHLFAVWPQSVDIVRFAFATYAPSKHSTFSPGPSDRDSWRVYFNYVNGLEGHYIICVDANTGEIYFEFGM